ncbi:MAG: hypothetical protein KatS3mg085_772 [Candidatus Dojkabacteria bacterium]|nr:MAG: hypothetical protein KatS3mg085_772 [Candidatus Dojkabacteria bacterium]
MKKFILALVIFFNIFIVVYAQQNAPSIVINEIFPNPDGSDSGKEWVELWNYGDESLELSNYKIKSISSSNSERTINLPNIFIEGNSYIVLANEDNFANGLNNLILLDDDINLFNSESSVFLIDANDVEIDSINYSSTVSGKSLERLGYKKNPECAELKFHPTSSSPGLENFHFNNNCVAIVNEPKILFTKDGDEWSESLESYTPVQVDAKVFLGQDQLDAKWYIGGSEVTFPLTFYVPFKGSITALINDQILESNGLVISAYPEIYITEVYPSPQSGEKEWVEIFNNSNFEINLEGMKLSEKNDEFWAEKSYLFPKTILQPKKYLLLDDLNITLNNNGDQLGIFDKFGSLISEVRYGNTSKGHSAILYYPYDFKENFLISQNILTPNQQNPQKPNIELKEVKYVKQQSKESLVKVRGIITSEKDVLYPNRIYIQDNTGGIRVEIENNTDLKEGDYLEIIGETNTYHRETEIKAKELVLLNEKPTFNLHLPKVFSIDDEIIGSLVQIEGIITKNYSSSFDLESNGFVTKVKLSSNADIEFEKSKGDKIRVVGIVSRYDESLRIMPRKTSDLGLILDTKDEYIEKNQEQQILGISSNPYKEPEFYKLATPMEIEQRTVIYVWPFQIILSIIIFIVGLLNSNIRDYLIKLVFKYQKIRENLIKEELKARYFVESMRR